MFINKLVPGGGGTNIWGDLSCKTTTWWCEL